MKNRIPIIAGLIVALIISGCTTGYQQMTATSFTGGYDQKDLGKDVWRVMFSSNGYTSQETCQTFWLYRCAELTVEQGFDGFEILSDITLSKVVPIEEAFGLEKKNFELAQYVPIYIPMDTGPKPFMQADILMLRGEIVSDPPRKFNAKDLIELLKPHVLEPIDKRKNVKPHIHEYLLPEGKLEQTEQI